MKNKKTLVLSLAALMSLGIVVGCGQSNNPKSETPASEAPSAQVTEAPASEAPATSEAKPSSEVKPSSEEPSLPPEPSSEAPVVKTAAAQSMALAVNDGQVTLVVTGSYEGYTDAEVKAFKPAIDIQENGNLGGGSAWARVIEDLTGELATINASNGVVTVSYDITNLKDTDVFMIHFSLTGEKNTSGEASNIGHTVDFKPGTVLEATSITNGDAKYTLSCSEAESWGLYTLRVENTAAPVLAKTGHSVEEIDGKIYLVLEGTYANYTEEEIKAMTPGFDLQQNQMAGAAGWARIMESDNNEAGTPIIEAKDGVWKVKYDISSAPDSNYTIHFSLTGERYSASDANNPNKIVAFNYDTAKDETVTLGGKKIRLLSAPGEYSKGEKYWSNAAIEITTLDPSDITFEDQAVGKLSENLTIGNYELIPGSKADLEVVETAEGATLGDKTYTKYLKTAGSSLLTTGSEYRVIKFSTTGAGKVTITARTGNATGSERSLFVYNVDKGVEHDKKVVSELGVYELELHYGGNFYIGATDNIQIFEIKVEYEDGVNPEWEPAIVLADQLQLNATGLPAGTYTNSTKLAFDNFVVNAGASADKQDVVIDSSKKSYDGVSYTQRLKLGGVGTYDYRSIDITVKEAARITIVCMSSNSTTDTSAALYNKALAMDAEGAKVGEIATITGSAVNAFVLTVEEAGTYCFVGTGSKGVNIYNIIIEYAE